MRQKEHGEWKRWNDQADLAHNILHLTYKMGHTDSLTSASEKKKDAGGPQITELLTFNRTVVSRD